MTTEYGGCAGFGKENLSDLLTILTTRAVFVTQNKPRPSKRKERGSIKLTKAKQRLKVIRQLACVHVEKHTSFSYTTKCNF